MSREHSHLNLGVRRAYYCTIGVMCLAFLSHESPLEKKALALGPSRDMCKNGNSIRVG